ncbi:TPA: putative holin [Providencia alcalifaciens]
MNEPLTGTTATSFAGVSIVGLFSGMDAGIVIGSFAGAVIFVLSSKDIGIPKRICFFIVSFVAGVLAAKDATGLLSAYFERNIDNSVGAMFSSAGLVGILSAISKPEAVTKFVNDVIGSAIDKWRGGRR